MRRRYGYATPTSLAGRFCSTRYLPCHSVVNVSTLLSRELDFLLFEVLDAADLCARERYRDFAVDTFVDFLQTIEKLAASHFAPFNRKGDEEEPCYTAGTVRVIPEVAAAWSAVTATGLHAAHHDREWNGIQMPSVLQHACLAHLFAANISFGGFSFQMMNEARINVALGSAALGMRGLEASLDYARQRVQGRPPSNKQASSPQIPIIGHSDVRRMLLAQKSFAEGSLALCLYASRLVDDQTTHPDLLVLPEDP